MEQNFDDLKNSLDFLKDFEQKITGLSTDDPQKLLDELGIDFDELNSHFEKSMEKKISLNYVNESDNKEPKYEYETDSGFDLRSTEDVYISAGDRKLVPTGLSFDIPEGYEIQVRSKSGLALKQGLMVLNSPGTIDSGYNSEIKVILFNTSKEDVKIEKGQKIAQAVLCPVVNGKWVDLVKVNIIKEKDRNSNGFGSTGIK
jgi:dUTP pyrophosphatase